ncbi:WSC domain-containing protein [Alternaria rosae]|uniref:WSC domain-containing protein n=1 Tax=Alternaria rosae TaxID=1187941 RepID=UPI001E8DFD1B|nr:WSC domain-containing protein [Alternaria rosae]KAH6879211.1 WSC domain-containing protein [Alternaria rosae]
MRASLLLLVSVLYTNVHAYDTQEVLGSLDVSGNSYQCTNGVTPSITCTDPSSNNYNCSCTCTNGITFEQPLRLPSQVGGGEGGSCGPSLVACQTAKDECSLREQELLDQLRQKEEQYQQLEREFSEAAEAAKPKPFKYQGCYTENAAPNRVLRESEITQSTMTIERCATICQDFNHYGLQAGSYCFCGNSFKSSSSQVGEHECSWPCAGNATQKCGAHARNSLYSKTM